MTARLNPYAKVLQTQPEIVTPTKLDVRGKLPGWLSGFLYRQGPGKYNVETVDAAKNVERDYKVQHWFDGLSMVHRFELISGDVFYRSRMCASSYEAHIRLTGSTGVTFGQRDPTLSTFGRLTSMFRSGAVNPPEGNAAVTVAPNWPLPTALESRVKDRKGDKIQTLVGKTDANVLMSLDPVTLEERGGFSYATYDKRLKGPIAPAHTHTDGKTREVYSYVMDFGRQVLCKVFALTPTKEGTKTTIIGEFVPPYASYIHSFWHTENYVILPFFPYYFRNNGLSIVWNQNVIDALEWDPKQPVVFVVVSKKEKKIVGKFRSESAFWGFHTINGFEAKGAKGTDLVLDIVASTSVDLVEGLYLDEMRHASKDYLSQNIYRVILKDVESAAPLSSSTIPRAQVTILTTPHGGDLPRINPLFSCTTDYRYAYLLGTVVEADETVNMFGAIRKVVLPVYNPSTTSSTEPIETVTWHEPGVHPAEPIFVPTPGGTDEDDGVLLTVCFSSVEEVSFLLVLDAKSMKEVARAGWFGGAVGDGGKVGPHIIPVGFHGAFVHAL
ncbi:hypothetical protein M427DRAFT_70166 [Gonapodya prolifera JEL478]|uniref:Carotenoid oxygenase n=1 Tax=Gonapodya prolifera (strain JEL478) TaxID=1344416 RepID=A0A139AF69_GONPJ|nr:hypothetical protein M427DRAFT_70166 [Gonapodya prolifera JEL478]|eukprot:KXS15063.1 hypothetical protein M427DRAFT_70166 [Gonapodya prolifera JEL478]